MAEITFNDTDDEIFLPNPKPPPLGQGLFLWLENNNVQLQSENPPTILVDSDITLNPGSSKKVGSARSAGLPSSSRFVTDCKVSIKPKKATKKNEKTKGATSRDKKPLTKKGKAKKQSKDSELAQTINDLLKPESQDKTDNNEDFDAKDLYIARMKAQHEEQMNKYEDDAKQFAKKKKDRELRWAANAIHRDRIQNEITKEILAKEFYKMRNDLQKIKDGSKESARHRAFYSSLKNRNSLQSQMIVNPYSDCQVDWLYLLMAETWLRTPKEESDNKDYVWKVILYY